MSKEHTLGELDELKAWFEKQELPHSLQVSKFMFIPNLKETIMHLMDQAYVCYANPKLEGCLLILEQIKLKLEEQDKA